MNTAITIADGRPIVRGVRIFAKEFENENIARRGRACHFGMDTEKPGALGDVAVYLPDCVVRTFL